MTYEFIIYEKKDRIAYITLNRPERMNALHYPAQCELWDALLDFKEDPEVWVAILTGKGEKAFCAGNDIKESANPDYGPGQNRPWGDWQRSSPTIPGPTGFLPTELWKPIIAAVNGYALGGGMEMTLHADIVVASENASFGLPEITIGATPGSGGLFKAPRQLPQKIATYMILTGERFSAEEMYRLGYVSRVVPSSELLSTAEKIAERICQSPPLNVRAAKEAILRGLDLPVDYPVTTYNLFKPDVRAAARGSDDAVAARQAFLDKKRKSPPAGG